MSPANEALDPWTQAPTPPVDPRRIERVLRALGAAGRPVVVAVSGGIDSVVLLNLLHRLGPSFEMPLLVAHVNHGLRGEESDEDETFVRSLAAGSALEFRSARVDPRASRVGVSNRDRPTLQEAARTARRAALISVAEAWRGDALIATAHTLDDQAETILLRVIRGCGPDALGGIAPVSEDGRWIRPLLEISRSELLASAQERRISWREDSSNDSDAYARNRLRHHWLPGLREEFNPQMLRALANLAEAHRTDSAWLDDLVAAEAAQVIRAARGGGLVIARDGWAERPEALARRLAVRALRQVGLGRALTRVHLDRVVAFLRDGRTGTSIELPSGVRMSCERGEFRLGAVDAQPIAEL